MPIEPDGLAVPTTISRVSDLREAIRTARERYSSDEAAEVFPLMPEEELWKLAADISANGVREPIVLYQGKVLDGRNRLIACLLAGVELRFIEWDGAGSKPWEYVLSRNLHRRHLTASQRALAAATLCQNFGMSTYRAADFMKPTNPESVRQAREVLEAGEPVLIEAVRAGRIPVHTAQVVAVRGTADDQVRIAAEGKKAASEFAKLVRSKPTSRKPSRATIPSADLALAADALDAAGDKIADRELRNEVRSLRERVRQIAAQLAGEGQEEGTLQ